MNIAVACFNRHCAAPQTRHSEVRDFFHSLQRGAISNGLQEKNQKILKFFWVRMSLTGPSFPTPTEPHGAYLRRSTSTHEFVVGDAAISMTSVQIQFAMLASFMDCSSSPADVMSDILSAIVAIRRRSPSPREMCVFARDSR